MTTIAYKDGVIAYDGRVTQGSHITKDDLDKHVRHGDAHFFLAGSRSDFSEFIDCFSSDKRGQAKHVNASAFVYSDGVLYEAGCNSDDGFWYTEVSLSDANAIGSGCSYAHGAMDAGADAKTAVRLAAKRDAYTGGKIRTWSLPK